MFDLVYDVSHDYWKSPRIYKTLAIPAVWVIISGYETFRNPEFDIFGFPRPAPRLSVVERLWFPRWFYAIFFVFGLCWLAMFATLFMLTYVNRSMALHEGCKLIEGVVGLPTADGSGWVAPGSFTVGGVNVEYEHDVATRGFKGSRVDQGPLREDLYARVCYADIRDKKAVLRLYLRRPE